MRRNKKIKLKRSIKLSYIIWIVLFFIGILTILLINNFNKNINPKVEKIVNMDINKMIENLITEYSLNEDYNTIKNITFYRIIEIFFEATPFPSMYNRSLQLQEGKNEPE